MKKLFLSAIAMAFVLVSCNQKNKQIVNATTASTETASQLYACSMHPEITGKKDSECSKCGMQLTQPVNATTEKVVANTTEPSTQTTTTTVSQTPFSIDNIVNNYLTLKNALTKDDAKGAGVAGKTLYATFNAVRTNSIDLKFKNEYLDIADDAKEHAEHIGANADKLEHQREHFVMLSKDINDLIKMFRTKQKLYQDFCPMANDGKGAIWISEVKEIKNPYKGSKMLTCGSMKKAL